MSGFAGAYFLDGRLAEGACLESMVEALAERGPDGFGIWHDGPIGLGHRMLWTTPESLSEKLPFCSRTRDLAITADARIDNREELIAALGLAGRPPVEIADSELILNSYERWGESCPEKLLGDFAFAVWDRRKQTVFCARDHMGLKPFYYYKSDKVFLFASEMKALFAFPEAPRKLNETMVANYLTATFFDTAATFYRDILRLPPGHSMTVSRDNTSLRCYWSLDPSREVRLPSDESYAETLREIFAEAVRCRLRSAYPVGSELSGGLDSSSVTCMARNILSERGSGPLHTFSAVFNDVPECDERRYINAVLAQGGLEPHFVRADCLNPLGDIELLFGQLDEPFWLPSMFMYRAMYKASRSQGVRVLLSGDDGDNAVGYGDGYITELALAGRWIAAGREILRLAERLERSPWRAAKHYAIRPLLRPLIPRPVLRFRRFLHSRLRGPSEIINPRFARRLAFVTDQEILPPVKVGRSRLDQWRNLTDGVNVRGCEGFNQAGARFFIELRYPFFDRRLLEFCLAVPPSQKLCQGWIRMIMRRALHGILPPTIQWRGGKTDLKPNFDRALLMFGGQTLKDVMANETAVLERYVNLAGLCKTYRNFISGQKGGDSFKLWSAVTCALWLRQTNLNP
jgi:asparagine synthase (glutamine-hydrolysing)